MLKGKTTLEETRISRMYLAMIQRAFIGTFDKIRTGLRSTITWIVLLVLALVGAGIYIHEKGRGHFHQLKTQIGVEPASAPEAPPQPGGQPPIILHRESAGGALAPELVSATLLPGRGMNILQITAAIPGRGEIALLASPSTAEAAKAMTGINDDINGEESLNKGNPLELPWAGTLSGSPALGGDGILLSWHDRRFTVPIIATGQTSANASVSTGGLLLRRASTNSSASDIPDGSKAQASFDAGDFNGNWPSNTKVDTSVVLRGHSLDITVTARNTGSEPAPMGIGWQPRFVLPQADRAQMRLRLPSSAVVETKDGLPTGQFVPVIGTDRDFSAPGGAPLSSIALDDTFAHLQQGSMALGPEVELRNPAGGYGLRITALSSSIKAVHVTAPVGGSSIVINPMTTLDDPFNHQWSKDEDTGLVLLQPGQSLEWKIRVELFALGGQQVSMAAPAPRHPAFDPAQPRLVQ